MLGLCGCEVIEDFGVSQVMEQLQTELGSLINPEGNISVITVEEYEVRSPEFNTCYNTLNKTQKKLYSALYSIAEQMPEGFVRLTGKYDGIFTDMHIAYTAMLCDHAEIFWMPITYLVGEIKSFGKTYATVAFEYENETNKVSYKVSREERDSMRKELEEQVKSIVSKTSEFGSDYEKELFFNDYICANTEYDTDARLNDTSYGCLVLKRALCEGYSRAFKLLCNESDIACDLVIGVAEGEGHMWNVANIDGTLSYVDVTWNDGQEGLEHCYFNITEQQLSEDHTVASVFSELKYEELQNGTAFNFLKRECTYTGNSYYNKSGLILGYDYAKTAAKAIKDDKAKGKKYSAFALQDEAVIAEFNSDPDKFLSKIQRGIGSISLESYLLKRDILVVFYQ